MNRTVLPVAFVFGTSSLLLVDSAVKGGVILAIAACAAMLLRRDSAATRHLVWLVAIVAMLIVPVCSVMLPQWQVLPAWAAISEPSPVSKGPDPAMALTSRVDDSRPARVSRAENDGPPPSHDQSFLASEASRPEFVSASPIAGVTPEPVRPHWVWLSVLPILWAIGFCALALRLMAARFMLWSNERRGTMIAFSGRKSDVRTSKHPASDGAIIAAFQDAHRQLGVRQQVLLLIHSERTIPVIWGIVRFRLLLPESARQWSSEQLRSVLLHELAHIKRRDTIVQLLAQIACALHWFNPLVWFAAWRLHVERERACDDLVLAQGVRASAYAEHLLNVATKFSVARWTSACGLAMASPSPLESRLQAILSERLNRRKVSTVIGMIGLLLGASIVIPLAMLRAAATNKPETAREPKGTNANQEVQPQPKQKDARALFEIWQRHARASGDIPGALVGELAAAVKTFIDYNPTWETVPKLNAILPRLDATRDWKPEEAAALLEEVAAAQVSPLNGAADNLTGSALRIGEALPKKFADATWGDPQPNGLRAAWVLEPGAVAQRMGAALKARLLVQNSGDKPLVVRIPTFFQGTVTATDRDAKPIEVTGTSWTTRQFLVTHRLAPGAYAKVNTPGVGFGKDAGRGPWAGARVGWNVMAKPGDWVRLEHAPLHLSGDGLRDNLSIDDESDWWQQFIQSRLNRELPLPVDAAERTRLLERVVHELFATAPTAEETAAFVADQSPTALDVLAKRLAARKDVVWFSGKLLTAPTKFRVLVADANADKQPRVVLGPGEYPLSAGTSESGAATLKIVGRPVGDRRTNDAKLMFEPTEFTGKLPPDPYKLEVPDGWGTWAIVCRPGDGFFYLLHQGGLRKIDYSNPLNVTDTPSSDLPTEFLDEVKLQLDILEIPEARQAEIFKIAAVPAEAAGIPPKLESRVVTAAENASADADEQYVESSFPVDDLVGESVIWNDVQNGLSLGYRITGDEWRILGQQVKVELWVQNPGKQDVRFQLNMRPDIGLRMNLKSKNGAENESNIVPTDVPLFSEHRLLPPGHALKVKEFPVSLLWPDNDVSGIKDHYFLIDPDTYEFHCELEMPGFSATGEGGKLLTPAAGEWTGKLTTRTVFVKVIAPDAPSPKPRTEYMEVDISKDGEVSLFRKKMPLDELKTRAARNANKWFTIHADQDVPFAKVIEVLEALKAVGITELSFSEARVGDGKYRVANRTANYEFDDKHGFSICRPSEAPQFFTVRWPAEGDRPACWLRTYPSVSAQTQGKWAVVWEPGTDVLWWVDDSDVGKMTLTDPVRVVVDREGRTNNFSSEFGLPEEVKTEFRQLGFEIGREPVNGRVPIGGNASARSIVSAEIGAWKVEGTVTDIDGKPLANVPVRVSTNQEIKTEKTNAKGEYQIYFSLPLQLLAHSRAVTVEPVLEGFTERDMAKAGQFNILLRAGEQPQRLRLAGDTDFQPGPIPRFAERDLLPSPPGVSPGNPGRADFVMRRSNN